MSKIAELKYHPYVYLFPRLNKQEFEDLKKDIAANGQALNITVGSLWIPGIWLYQGELESLPVKD